MLTQRVLSGEITSLSALTKGVRNSNNVMLRTHHGGRLPDDRALAGSQKL